jgi:hypothetical protein
MTRRSFPGRVMVVVATAWAVAGCGGGVISSSRPPTVEEMAMQEVADLYKLYYEQHKKPPQKPQDFEVAGAGLSLGYSRILNGDFVVRWGVPLADISGVVSKADSPDEVLAYEKKAPEQGGVVLMKDRSIRTMTAEQFKAAPKAGGSK